MLGNAFAGYKFPAEAPVTYVFPNAMFLAGSDLSPLEENMGEMLKGLTEWAPSTTALGVSELKTVEVEGADYAEVFTRVNDLFTRNFWSDSLHVVPPTEALVNWILTGTDMSPDDVIGGDKGFVMPRGGISSVRSVAVALAMAGGRPEYLPFLIAAVDAIVNPEAVTQSWNATTCSVFPAFVVNGPMARQIRLGAGYGCLGPDPQHPAGQILGRAVRIILQDLGGAIPGIGTMAIHGGNRATNAFFAEDDAGIPAGWTTWAEDRGYRRDQNVVTLSQSNGLNNVNWDFGDLETNTKALNMMAGYMATPNVNRINHTVRISSDNVNMNTGVVILPREFIISLAEANGFSKLDTKRYLWDNSMLTYSKTTTWGFELIENIKEWQHLMNGDSLIPVCPRPEQIAIVMAGGEQGGHGYFLSPITQGDVTSAVVKLPANWDQLLADAEEDLGPISATR